MHVLGYDVAKAAWLEVNEHEAARVRTIFQLYLELSRYCPRLRSLSAEAGTTSAG